MRRWTSAVSLVLAAGCACGAKDRQLLVDLYTDYRPGVEFTAVRVEMSDTPFTAPGRVITAPLHEATAEASYVEGIRVAELDVEHCERVYVRLSLLDAAGRKRGERLVEVPDECATRAIRVDVSLACAGVACADGTQCRAGACVASECGADAGICGECATDGECPAPALACQSPVCTEAGCLVADGCPGGEYCAATGCATRPTCGDGACDPSTETPCSCPSDCASPSCPPTCTDGACDPGESSESCPEDCGPPPFVCGDTICEVLEVCAPDCDPGGGGACGDATCDAGETCASCPECCVDGCTESDCVGCGDGTCEASDGDCPIDCGRAVACDDGRCDAGEETACPADCPAGAAVCGDGDCVDGMESCGSCQPDCGWCTGEIEVPADAACVRIGAGDDGAVCGAVPGAYTSAAVNLAYYPMFVGLPDPEHVGAGGTGIGLYSAEGELIRDLPVGTRFAVQSTRNPTCAENPPLRPRLHGYAFGYTPDGATLEASVGWARVAFLVLDADRTEACVYGPQGEGFAVRENPYARPFTCEPIDCVDGGAPRTCRDANPTGEGAGECGGSGVDMMVTVTAETLWLRYSAGGPPRRILHAGDTLRVRYDDGAGWYFARISTSTHPMLNPRGSIGWVQATYVTP